jgi:hypothetical protein
MRKWSLLLLLCAVIPATATVRYVSSDGTGDFTTIQTAVNASIDGDTIVIRGDQGPHNASVSVTHRLVILGQGSGCGGVAPSEVYGGFVFQPGSSNSVIGGMYVHGTIPIIVQNAVTGIAIRRCRVEGATGQLCVEVNGSNISLVIEESVITAGTTCRIAHFFGINSALYLDNCIVTGLDNTSIGFYNVTATNTLALSNCDILNIDNFTAGTGGGNWLIDNSIFWQTAWDGTLNAGTTDNSYNAITAGMTNFPGTNNITITSNPFESWTAPHDVCVDDVHLAQASGLIDAGDPNLAPDRDGSTRDPGVYGGPLNYEVSGAVDYPFVTFFSATPNVPQGGILELHATGRVGRGE